MDDSTTPDDPTRILRKIGLTPNACLCYLFLAAQLPRACRTANIAEQIPIAPSSLFRALNELTVKGFVQRTRFVRAASYRAEPLTHALDNYATYQRQLARPILRQQRKAEADNIEL